MLSESEQKVVSHCIRWHDAFGRLERGLWDHDYSGGMSPSEVRRVLQTDLVPFRTMVRIARALWLADVGSVPALRWLRPLAAPLEGLILECYGEKAGTGLQGARCD